MLDSDVSIVNLGSGIVETTKYILIVEGNTYMYDNLNAAYQDIVWLKLQIGQYKLFKGEEVL